MYHVTLVSKVEGSHQLQAELAHDCCRHHELLEPDAEGPQVLSHKLQYKAYVVTVGPPELKIVDQVADVFVAHQFTVSGTKVSENLPFEDVMILVVTFCTQNFESPESVLIIMTARYRVN